MAEEEGKELEVEQRGEGEGEGINIFMATTGVVLNFSLFCEQKENQKLPADELDG